MADTIDTRKSEELSETHICKTTENTVPAGKDPEDKLLWGRNKRLPAHAEAPEAAGGAWIGLLDANIGLVEEVAA